MSLIYKMTVYNQVATYWEKSSINEYGEQTFNSPVQKNVRWENKLNIAIDKKTGKIIDNTTVVYIKELLKQDGYLYLGTTTESNPKNLTDAYRIKRVDNFVGLRNTRTIYKVYL